MIHHGDALDVLKTLDPNSIDAIVTDPPYGWRFMGKAWDAPDIQAVLARDKTLPTDDKTTLGMAAGKYDNSLSANQSFQLWTEQWAKETFRVLKPGGHALIFCGPRTYHRMASGVEDAGFEIRDQLQWLFGSGFPKSHNLGDGWGTALKPANEPIVLARKPLSEKTVALNVLKWGCGALNIDASRITIDPSDPNMRPNSPTHKFQKDESGFALHSGDGTRATQDLGFHNSQGRWPANLLLDEEAAEMLDEQSGTLKSGSLAPGHKRGDGTGNSLMGGGGVIERQYGNDSGGASRFFYCAKASKAERNRGLEGMPEKDTHRYGAGIGEGHTPEAPTKDKNFHPTVKPIKLMEYLIRLITPPGGVVLDPFAGSGSTLVAAKNLGFKFIGIEMNEEYVEIARRRIGA